MIRILLVDDQVLFVETLKDIIDSKIPDIEVVGIAFNGQEAVEATSELKPDIILMDVRMPILDGVQATKKIHRDFPEIKIMMLTTFDDDEYVYDAIDSGAVGYLLKNMSPTDLIDAVRSVSHGTAQFSAGIVASLVSASKSGVTELKDEETKDLIELLSRRERETLFLMSRGYDNAQIASKLFVAEQTVRNHVHNIYKKLEVKDRISAIKASKRSSINEYCMYLLDDQ